MLILQGRLHTFLYSIVLSILKNFLVLCSMTFIHIENIDFDLTEASILSDAIEQSVFFFLNSNLNFYKRNIKIKLNKMNQ